LKITSGLAYFSTSSHNNLHNIGKTNITKTVIATQMTAYLIVFKAGFILSSFHHERTNKRDHHNAKIIENIHATNTNIAIVRETKSHAHIFASNSVLVLFAAFTVFIKLYISYIKIKKVKN